MKGPSFTHELTFSVSHERHKYIDLVICASAKEDALLRDWAHSCLSVSQYYPPNNTMEDGYPSKAQWLLDVSLHFTFKKAAFTLMSVLTCFVYHNNHSGFVLTILTGRSLWGVNWNFTYHLHQLQAFHSFLEYIVGMWQWCLFRYCTVMIWCNKASWCRMRQI